MSKNILNSMQNSAFQAYIVMSARKDVCILFSNLVPRFTYPLRLFNYLFPQISNKFPRFTNCSLGYVESVSSIFLDHYGSCIQTTHNQKQFHIFKPNLA